MANIKEYRVHGLAIGSNKNTAENTEKILIVLHEGAEENLKLKYSNTMKNVYLDEADLKETITGTTTETVVVPGNKEGGE